MRTCGWLKNNNYCAAHAARERVSLATGNSHGGGTRVALVERGKNQTKARPVMRRGTRAAGGSSNAPVPKTNAPLVVFAAGYPRPVQTMFEAQLALDRQGISSGSLDEKSARNARGDSRISTSGELPITGELDATTKSNLTLNTPPLTTYVVTSNDLAGSNR